MPPPRLRPTSLFSGCSNITRTFLVSQPSITRRTYFTVPALVEIDNKLQNGIPPVYSPHQFQIAWKEYQTHILDRLNLATAGTNLQSQHPLQVAILTSRDSDRASTFNYASMAHNNHFFFESITANPAPPPSVLMLTIQESFGHIDILKETFIATALACFSNAFVWLVLDHHNRKLKVLTTYNSGTPYGLSHRRQSVDVNTTSRPQQDASAFPSALQTPDYSNSSDNYTRSLAIDVPENEEAAGREGGFSPLLCVNVWEHAWLVDYGFDKKEEYLNNWWEAVDWGVVWSRLEPCGFGKKPERKMHGGGPAPVRDDSGGDVGGTRLADEVARRSGSR